MLDAPWTAYLGWGIALIMGIVLLGVGVRASGMKLPSRAHSAPHGTTPPATPPAPHGGTAKHGMSWWVKCILAAIAILAFIGLTVFLQFEFFSGERKLAGNYVKWTIAWAGDNPELAVVWAVGFVALCVALNALRPHKEKPHGAAAGHDKASGHHGPTPMQQAKALGLVIVLIVLALGAIRLIESGYTVLVATVQAQARTSEYESSVRKQEDLFNHCGTDGWADCKCKGDRTPTRILRKGEHVRISAVDPQGTFVGFDPAPSPTTFKMCDARLKKCVSNNTDTLQVGSTITVVNLSGSEFPLYCGYHD